MIKLKINGNAKQVPTAWHECDLRTVRLLDTAPDQIGVLAALVGATPQEFEQYTDIEGLHHLMAAAGFFNTEFIVPPMPTKIGRFEVEQDVASLKIGQYKDLQAVAATEGDKYEGICEAVAIYLQPATNLGRYDYAQAKMLMPEVWQLNAAECVAIYNFFLNAHGLLRSGIRKEPLLVASLRKNWRQAMTVWRRLASSIRFRILWRTLV